MLRDSLRLLLGAQTEFEVVGETGRGGEALRLVGSLAPHIVLLDIDLPELNGVAATEAIVKAHPSVRIVILSLHAEARFVEETLKAGASGYLGDDCDFTQLSAAIRAVMAGQTYLSPAVTKVVVAKYLSGSAGSVPGPFGTLTARQREVLQRMAEGKSTKEIALSLHLSGKTVETHRQQLMERLNLHTVAELTKYAVREGLTGLEQ